MSPWRTFWMKQIFSSFLRDDKEGRSINISNNFYIEEDYLVVGRSPNSSLNLKDKALKVGPPHYRGIFEHGTNQ